MTARIRKMTQDTKSDHKQSKMVEKKCMDERKKDRDQPPTKVNAKVQALLSSSSS